MLLVAAAGVARPPGWAAPRSVTARGIVFASPGTPIPQIAPRPSPGDSVLVFAAHPDDETLGAGGLIHAALAAGARVQVVIFTNGDGYVEGVDVGFHTLFSTPELFIQYGKRRQQEALAAAAGLGLPPDRVIFLGYPDRGLAALWGSTWDCDHPYTSPYTRRHDSPYDMTYHRGAAYCGQNVLDDVEGILRRERPTVIAVHDAEDTHRDHWAAGAFTILALERLALGQAPPPTGARVLLYLVHRGAWPRPEAYAPELPLDPPQELEAVRPGWAQFPLSPADEDAKREAILAYRSQVQLLRSFMLSFVRRNELFAVSAPVWPAKVDPGELSLTAPGAWDDLRTAIRAPQSGSLIYAAEGSAKLDSVALGRDSDHLYIAVRLRKPAIRETQYRIELRLLYRDTRMARLSLIFHVPQALAVVRVGPEDLPLPAGAAARSFGPSIDVVLPLAPLDNPVSLFMQVVTIGPLKTLVDRTPWTLVHLDQPPSAGAAGPAGDRGILEPSVPVFPSSGSS